jgi:uncharacterized protein (DUF1800 family)
VLRDLTRHRATARFIATKLARHFVADDPPAALVARLAADFERTGGDLPSLYRTLVAAPEAWQPQPAKLKSPEEFAISSARLLRLGEGAFGASARRSASARWASVCRPRLRPRAGPTAPRSGWARTRCGSASNGPPAWPVLGRQVDARNLAVASLGPLLQADTLQQIERAADGPQALALLLLSPEFQRR